MVLIAGAVASMLGGGNRGRPTVETSNYAAEFGGNASVYARIAGLSSCEALQAEFDIAADNNDLAVPGTAEHRGTLGYMTAALDRMEAVGCS